MSDELKQDFVYNCVREYLQDLVRVLPSSIQKKKIGATDSLIKSFGFNAIKSGSGASGTLSFDESGRMVDMGVGRRHPIGSIESVSISLLGSNKTGMAEIKSKGRAPKKWYSPVVYARLNYLENKLMHGFSDAVREELLKMRNGI